MTYKTLLFDLDGTLLNTLTDLSNALNHALSRNGYPTHTETACARMVGNGVAVLIARALPGGEENPDFPKVFADFRAYYEAHKTDETAPYDGILPMLSALSAAGCAIGIVSNKLDAAVKALAADFFSDTVRVAIGERASVAKKPAPDAVFAAFLELGADAEDAAFVGDSEVDIETARNAGIPCLSVSWGFRTREQLMAAGATQVFETPAALAEYLLN
jgi:phosphoglycolate phosphatase